MDFIAKLGIAVGIPLAASGLSYGIFESLWPGSPSTSSWANGSTHFWDNTVSFYKGLVGNTNEFYSKWAQDAGQGHQLATIPKVNILGWIKDLKYLQINLKRVIPTWENLLGGPRIIDEDGERHFSEMGLVFRLWSAFWVYPYYSILREIIRVPIIRLNKPEKSKGDDR